MNGNKIKTLVTADDFGFSQNINKAIVDTYEKGRVTELSLMVDCYGSKEAVEYIKSKNIQNVGLHFSLCRIAKGGKILKGNDYDPILKNWTKEQLITAFNEELELFEQLLGFKPKHVIGHKQIALHAKLVEYIGNYCVKNNCYVRSSVSHSTLQSSNIPHGFNIGRTTDFKLTFRYGSPAEMYKAYKNDLQEAKTKMDINSIEFVFHPGYAGDFEKNLTSFIQERIDDANFLLSDYFLKLLEEEGLQLVPSKDI